MAEKSANGSRRDRIEFQLDDCVVHSLRSQPFDASPFDVRLRFQNDRLSTSVCLGKVRELVSVRKTDLSARVHH
jgi:hypothetical protein